MYLNTIEFTGNSIYKEKDHQIISIRRKGKNNVSEKISCCIVNLAYLPFATTSVLGVVLIFPYVIVKISSFLLNDHVE